MDGDDSTRRRVLATLGTLGGVLHDLEHAVRVADNLVAMRDGEPYDWGPPGNVLTEALLADVFGVAATVDHGGDGPRVHAHRALDDGEGPDETR